MTVDAQELVDFAREGETPEDRAKDALGRYSAALARLQDRYPPGVSPSRTEMAMLRALYGLGDPPPQREYEAGRLSHPAGYGRAPAAPKLFPAPEGYEKLAAVLQQALDQAAVGKGRERHATGKAFHEQPILSICRLVGPGFAAGQAVKKTQEAMRMDKDAAQRELLGAINYLAALHIFFGEQ